MGGSYVEKQCEKGNLILLPEIKDLISVAMNSGVSKEEFLEFLKIHR